MIPGYATPQGTADYAAQHDSIDFNDLGSTGLRCSAAGFGGYRVAAGVADHRKALEAALNGGVNLIDTSANYTDGESERLVGEVLETLIKQGSLRRNQVIVVSKVGYLQGQNYALSQERKARGRGFEELVEYGQDLEHCIHPDFLNDQLTRSLERLNLETLDVYLLHNPEYYLGWAAREGIDAEAARSEFYGRIRRAFGYLEEEVARGRIRAYGVSANTLPAAADNAELVSLEQLCACAAGVSDDHHFRVVQFPLNLFEAGAVLERNQSGGQSVLELARSNELAVLINRPLNAFSGQRLVRLAEVPATGRYKDDDITSAINQLNKSENRLWRRLLPAMQLPTPLYQRIKDQVGVAVQLKHYWRNFGSYARWSQARDGFLRPHVQGVLEFLSQRTAEVEGLAEWVQQHGRLLDAVLNAVGSLYVGEAQQQIKAIRARVQAADADWAAAGALSRMALRAVRSTRGVSCTLVGMRRADYVKDVLKELGSPVQKKDRNAAWSRISDFNQGNRICR
jgi:aryl-alcohol dehydrogenase-like predicted oxidoreductase